MEKKWYESKTLYANGLALLAIILQGVYGKDIIPLELQASLIPLINIILRMITRKAIIW